MSDHPRRARARNALLGGALAAAVLITSACAGAPPGLDPARDPGASGTADPDRPPFGHPFADSAGPYLPDLTNLPARRLASSMPGNAGAAAGLGGGRGSDPLIVPARPGLPCPPGSLAPGWLAVENHSSGPALRVAATSAAAGRVVGYPSSTSARCGDLVGIQLSAPKGSSTGSSTGRSGVTVRVAAYRMGWYRGAGSRLIWRSDPVRVVPRPVPSGAPAPHLVQPDWPATIMLTIDAGWPPGMYLLVPTGSSGPVGPGIPLVLRDDAGTEPILFKASTLTWNAYNDWGGWNLYRGPTHSVADRARVVALNRPLSGEGYEQLTLMDLPVVRFAEQVATGHRLDLGYATDTDVDARPELLTRHAELLVGGHSEYWTTAMYDGLLAARDAGVNLVFLGANNLWWHSRMERSPGATLPDRQAVYRFAVEDPAARTDPAAATVLWGSRQLGRDPASVLAASHAAIEVHGGLQVISAPSWFVAGTALRVGSTLPGTVGNEADGFNPAAGNPGATEILAAGVLRGSSGP
ncbi:MAG TPA: N,N-dimethylformamidase beta subunit family domain-containing protein, partial [Kineosporiaceae bacterium]|nr:N,N-dimethylformamidase beta subunit family domain-containing protein [Kineosporiaceae bacterium]